MRPNQAITDVDPSPKQLMSNFSLFAVLMTGAQEAKHEGQPIHTVAGGWVLDENKPNILIHQVDACYLLTHPKELGPPRGPVHAKGTCGKALAIRHPWKQIKLISSPIHSEATNCPISRPTSPTDKSSSGHRRRGHSAHLIPITPHRLLFSPTNRAKENATRQQISRLEYWTT